MNLRQKTLCTLGLTLLLPAVSQADLIEFNFTGRVVVADVGGNILVNEGLTYTPIQATLIYNTVSGLGSSNLSITMLDAFWNEPATFHDISMSRQGSSNLFDGQILVDWAGNMNMPMHVEWDATGLLNAIDYGLQAGDVLSGSDLYHDTNGNGLRDADEPVLFDIGSATPYSDSLTSYLPHPPQGPAPLAATMYSQGLDATTPFPGIKGYVDIGSGNSMHVVSVVSAVPVPAAVWLFGSGLIGLIGVARRKTTRS